MATHATPSSDATNGPAEDTTSIRRHEYHLSGPTIRSVWFAQVEHQFVIAGVTQDATKYCYIAGNLKAQYEAEVRDVLTNPPTGRQYVTLFQTITSHLICNSSLYLTS